MLVEHYINLIDNKQEKEKYFDEVWDLLNKAYDYIGGVQGTDKEEMMSDNLFWKLVRKGGKIVACQIYKFTPDGRKIVLGGAEKDETTGKATPLGKEALYKLISDEVKFKDRNSYAEVSDTMEYLYATRFGANKIKAKDAEKILHNKKITPQEDEYHYDRYIGDKKHTKMMVGNPKSLVDK